MAFPFPHTMAKLMDTLLVLAPVTNNDLTSPAEWGRLQLLCDSEETERESRGCVAKATAACYTG